MSWRLIWGQRWRSERGLTYSTVVPAKAGTYTPYAAILPSLRAKRSNPESFHRNNPDCFVAESVIGPRGRADPLAHRNDETGLYARLYRGRYGSRSCASLVRDDSANCGCH